MSFKIALPCLMAGASRIAAFLGNGAGAGRPSFPQ